jgi:putative cardiolipin synthase
MPNVEVKVFNPFHSNLVSFVTDFRKIMSSNHDKILVVDGEYAIVGGRNISMDYFLTSNDHPTAFRDCDVVIRNREIAEQLSYAFGEEFAKKKTYVIGKELWGNIDIMSSDLMAAYDTMDSHIRNEPFKARKGADDKYEKAASEWNSVLSEYKELGDYTGFDPLENAYDCPVKIVDKHSLGGPRNDITDQMIKYIDGCKKEVLIQNPYVVLTDRMFAALKRAGKRGVKVIIHTNSPYSTDSLATQAMFYADFKRVMSEIPGVRVFVFYKDGKLHAKNWVFDSKIGVVGTYNLDYMSEQINSEVVAAVKSTEFSKELRDEIMSDVADSKEYLVEVNDKGEVKTIVGPDDIPGKNFWLLKTLSKFTIFKKLI